MASRSVQFLCYETVILFHFCGLKERSSESGIPLLRIKFPDNAEDDFAVLKPFQFESEQPEQAQNDPKSCIFSGNLLHDSSVLVTVAGGCPNDNSFEVNTIIVGLQCTR